jgi:glucan phosphoethanolaminetransferase (alkaline phosphatase superfamily)
MKDSRQLVKMSIILIVFISAILIAVYLAMVIPEELSIKNFIIYGFCSIFFVCLSILILRFLVFKNDCDKMINREIELKDAVDRLNDEVYTKKGILWTVSKYGSFLVAKL